MGQIITDYFNQIIAVTTTHFFLSLCRKLGLVVCRGPAVVVICPLDGMEAIANPFVQQE
jgi:hypothetical protein